MQYKKKPLLYKIKQFWDDNFCDYRHRFIGFKWIRDLKYWFKYTFISPINVLKIKTLPRGPWRDRDEIMLHSNFQILTDFVEKECSNKCFKLILLDIDKEMESFKNDEEDFKNKMKESFVEQNRVTQEIKDLYDWWKVKRQLRIKNEPFNSEDYPGEDIITEEDPIVARDEYGDPTLFIMNWKPDEARKAYYDKQNAYEEMSEKEDEEMLIRLMKIRKCLWT